MISYWFLFSGSHFLWQDFFSLRLLIAWVSVFIFFAWLFYYTSFSQSSLVILKNELLIKALVFSEIFLVVSFLPLGIHLTSLSLSLLYIIMITSPQIYLNKTTSF